MHVPADEGDTHCSLLHCLPEAPESSEDSRLPSAYKAAPCFRSLSSLRDACSRLTDLTGNMYGCHMAPSSHADMRLQTSQYFASHPQHETPRC